MRKSCRQSIRYWRSSVGSFAFAALKKIGPDEYDPNSGPGANSGEHYDDEDDDTKSDVFYSISGEEPVVPFVPFKVTVTASDKKTGSKHGTLVGSFIDDSALNYDILSTTSWSKGVKKYTCGVRNCDCTKNGVKFGWKISGKDTPTCVLAYNAGFMVPDIVDFSVKRGQEFEFKIRFCAALGGAEVGKCYGKWEDFGASYYWEAWHEGMNKWIGVQMLSSSQEWEVRPAQDDDEPDPIGQFNAKRKWYSGVLSGTATCNELEGCTKIRLCVDYDGRDTQYDEADLEEAEPFEIDAPEYLHIYGDSDMLTISSPDLSLASVGLIAISALVNDEEVVIGDWIETAEGRPLDFTQGWVAVDGGGIRWQGAIRAVNYQHVDDGEPLDVDLVLRISFAGQNTESTITIVQAIDGSVDAPSEEYVEDTFNVAFDVIGAHNLPVPRFDCETLTIIAVCDDENCHCKFGDDEYSDGNSASISGVEWEFDGTNWSLDNVRLTVDGECTVTIQLWNGYEKLDEADVRITMPNFKLFLAEAINERILAKTGMDGDYEDTNAVSRLYSGAISAAMDFVDGDVTAQGGYILFTQNNPLNIDQPSDGWTNAQKVAWAGRTYNKLIKATTRVKTQLYSACEHYHGVHEYIYKDESGSINDGDGIVRRLWRQLYDEANSNHLTDFGDLGLEPSTNSSEIVLAAYYLYDATHRNSEWNCYLMLEMRSLRFEIPKEDLYIGATLKMYFRPPNEVWATIWNTFGHHVIGSATSAGCAYTAHCPARADFTTDWIGGNNFVLGLPDYTVIDNSERFDSGAGYSMAYGFSTLTYDFKHK